MTGNALDPSAQHPCTMTESTVYDHYHLNAPVPNLETEADPSFSLVTSNASASDEDVFLHDQERNDSDDHVPTEVEYESDHEITETDDDASCSSEAEVSEDEQTMSDDEGGFHDSDYESECTMDYQDDSDGESCASISRRHDHELFLPHNVSPSYEQLKFDEDDESDEEMSYHRTYMSTRPRMMMMLPTKQLYSNRPSPSNISDDSSEEGSLPTHETRGVSFNNTVTVHSVFETSVYTSSMIDNMYTKRDELRINKLRNKREYAYDDNDWENATEECDMETDPDGEYVHPVHTQKRTFLRGPFLSNASSSIWQPAGGTVHRAKRMRMYYP